MPKFSSTLMWVFGCVASCAVLVMVLVTTSRQGETVRAGVRSLSNLPGKTFTSSGSSRAGAECTTPVDVLEMTRVLMDQRNEISRLLDQTLQKLGQLQCDTKTPSQGEDAGEVAGTGGWCLKFSDSASREHLTDGKLVPVLAKFFRNKTVASFGDGPGEYKRLLDATGSLRRYDAYDGAPFVETATNGSVKHLDLSVPQFDLPVYEWVMSLEVAEHIPATYERAFLGNIARHARDGVVLSWAVPGQGGFHHVNLRAFDYVEARMGELGFVHDPLTTSRLREGCSLQWLRDNINVFRRKEDSQLCEDMA